MKPFHVFNVNVKNKATKVFGGIASGMCDWDDVKYPIMLGINEEMFSNLWSLNQIQIEKDIDYYEEVLSLDEKEAFDKVILSFKEISELIEKFNFHVGFVSSDPSIQQNTQLIGTFKGLHTNVFHSFLRTFYIEKSKEIHLDNLSKPIENFILLSGKGIALSTTEWNKEELETLSKALVQYLILTGIVFFGRAAYIHSLAKEQKMFASHNAMNVLKEDESRNLQFYGELTKIVFNENLEINTDQHISGLVQQVKEAAELEKSMYSSLFSGIESISEKDYQDYIEYLANSVLRSIGFRELYEDNLELKLNWIGKINTNISVQDYQEVDDDFDF